MKKKTPRISASNKALMSMDVMERDEQCCILCSAPFSDIAHVIPRSRSVKNDARLWQRKNLACLCRQCHSNGHNFTTRLKMMQVLHARWNYPYQEDELFSEYVAYL